MIAATNALRVPQLFCLKTTSPLQLSHQSSSTTAEPEILSLPIALWIAVGSPYRKPTERQRIGNEINATFIFARVDFVRRASLHDSSFNEFSLRGKSAKHWRDVR